MAIVRLKAGHVQPVWAGHPWVYAQAVERVEGGATKGDLVSVIDPRGNVVGHGFFSPGSAIPVRILARGGDEPPVVDRAFFVDRLKKALALRETFGLGGLGAPHPGSPAGHVEGDLLRPTTGYRLVHAEGDGLPGLIVDRFGDVLVVQFLTFGMKARENLVLEALTEVVGATSILDRTPAQVAKSEGIEPASGVVRGADVDALRFTERGFRYELPLELGQKTGFYFDQRDLRARVEELSAGARVLDTYGYVGAFALAAARGGAAEVTTVDESAVAQQVGASIALANGYADRITFVRQEARRALADAHAAYDLVIVDPPRLAPTRSSRDQALYAYSKLAELGCRATKPYGTLVFCSCSGAVDLGALTRALALGALRANVQALVVERRFQGIDHPVSAAFGEGLYLKALVARIVPR